MDWNSEDMQGMGGGGGGRGLRSLEFQTHGGVSALNFQRGKTAKASLEIADLIAFPVCKSSSKNRPRKQDLIRQVLVITRNSEQMGFAASSKLKRP